MVFFLSVCIEGILQLFTNFYLQRKFSIFLRNNRDCKVVAPYNRLPQDWPHGEIQRIGWPANQSRFITKWLKRGRVHNLDLLKKNLWTKILLKKAQTHKKLDFGKHPMLRFYEKHNLASKLFLFNRETQVKNFFESVFGKSSVIAGVHIFDTIAASLSNILIWTSTCGSVQYKRKTQNRKIQSKRVLGLTKYTHWLSNHKQVTQ